jgi:hypothetical protein
LYEKSRDKPDSSIITIWLHRFYFENFSKSKNPGITVFLLANHIVISSRKAARNLAINYQDFSSLSLVEMTNLPMDWVELIDAKISFPESSHQKR